MKANWLLISSLLLITSCTAPSQFYVRNLLPVSAKFILVNEPGAQSNDKIFFREETKVPQFGDNKFMNDKITHIQHGDSIIFTIPPHSTAYLGLGEAGQIMKLKSIVYFTPKEHFFSLDNSSDYDNIFSHKSSFGRHTFWLDIK